MNANNSTIHLVINTDTMNVIAATNSLAKTAKIVRNRYKDYPSITDEIERKIRWAYDNGLCPHMIATTDRGPNNEPVYLEYTPVPAARYATLIKLNDSIDSILVYSDDLKDLYCQAKRRMTELVPKRELGELIDAIGMQFDNQITAKTSIDLTHTLMEYTTMDVLTLIREFTPNLNNYERRRQRIKPLFTLLLAKNGRNVIANANDCKDLIQAASDTIEQDDDISRRMSVKDTMNISRFISSIEGHEASKIKTFDDGANTLYCVFMRNRNA